MADYTAGKDDAKDDDDSDVLAEAKERMKQAAEASADWRQLARDDLRFLAGNADNGYQWPDAILAQRKQDKRPALTFNQLPQFVKQIVNDIRQNRPAIKIRPTGSDVHEKISEVINGLVRHIQAACHAYNAYDLAADQQAACGLGYLRVLTEYTAPDSFEQDIKIKGVLNPFSVYFDPNCTEPDGSDAKWAFMVEDLTEDEFEEKYPDAEKVDVEALGEYSQDWVCDDKIRIADYYYIECEYKTLVMLKDGTSVYEDEITKEQKAFIYVDEKGKKKIRQTEVKTVKCCKLSGKEILEETEWPGTMIPVVPVYGDVINTGDETIVSGIVRNAKDAQRAYNFWETMAAEYGALAPKAPYIAAEGQLEGHEQQWEQANATNFAVLQYKPTAIAGTLIGAPQRQGMPQVPTGIVDQINRAQSNLRTITGIYQAALGQPSNETSGRAINARKKESDTAIFNYDDNLSKAIKIIGRIIVEAIPKIYDTKRTVRILSEDDTEQVITLMQHGDPSGMMQQQNIITGEHTPLYDLSVTKYDIDVDVGPSYATKRQEAADSMMQFGQSYPPAAQFIADLVARNMDWPGATQIADRLKKMLPPQLQEEEGGQQQMGPDGQPMPQIPPQIQAQMQQMQQQLQMAQQQMQAMQQQLQGKQAELQQQAQIEKYKIDTDSQTKLQIAQMRAYEIDKQAQTTIEAKRLEIMGKTPEQAQFENQGVADERAMFAQSLQALADTAAQGQGATQQLIASMQGEIARIAHEANQAQAMIARAMMQPKQIMLARDPQTGLISGAVATSDTLQ